MKHKHNRRNSQESIEELSNLNGSHDQGSAADELKAIHTSIYNPPDLKSSEKTLSEEYALKAIKTLLLDKSESFEGYTSEQLEKGFKSAFRTGVSVLGLIHGTQHFTPSTSDNNAELKRDPASQVREMPNNKKPSSAIKGSFKDKKISNFLKAISMSESSGGKNLHHEQMKSGIHAGDSAIGQYGLMPNTVKETVNRMGRDHPLHRKYSNMDNSQIGASLSANPDHENEIASHLANGLHDKFKGDESKMSYSWNQGHNLTNDHLKTSHADYKNHDYVQKYHKNKQSIEKNPNIMKQKNDIPSN